MKILGMILYAEAEGRITPSCSCVKFGEEKSIHVTKLANTGGVQRS